MVHIAGIQECGGLQRAPEVLVLATHGVLQDTQGRVHHSPETGSSGGLDLGSRATVKSAHVAPGNRRARAAVAGGFRGCRTLTCPYPAFKAGRLQASSGA